MAKVFPFKGIFYNKKIIKDLLKVTAPPYDVITEEERDKFYAVHPYNVIRLILGKSFPGDDELNNKYIRAERFFDSWLRHNILIQDEIPSIYIYEQAYIFERKKLKRVGFIALLRLEDIDRGKVYPHEETFERPRVDRLELIRTCAANFDSIFSMYSDKKEIITKILRKNMIRKPIIDLIDKTKIRHRIWRIESRGDIKKILKELTDKSIFIADGHHRYEAALTFRDEMKDKYQKFTGEEGYNHTVMYFTNIEGGGLTILPIHRLVKNIMELNAQVLIEKLRQFFEVEEFPFKTRNELNIRRKILTRIKKFPSSEHTFILFIRGINKYFLLKLLDEKILDKIIVLERSKEWKRLDVTIAHELIIKRILGIGGERIQNEDIGYTKNVDEAIENVKIGKYQLAILLNPTKVSEIVAIASGKERLPQKSTFFYPKLLTGLVMNKIFLDEKVKF